VYALHCVCLSVCPSICSLRESVTEKQIITNKFVLDVFVFSVTRAVILRFTDCVLIVFVFILF